MSDTLLDEATRLADNSPSHPHAAALLRALVERVRAAEAGEREAREHMASNGYLALRMEAQRDEARAKLDVVRAWLDDVYDDGTEWRDLRRLRAILDGDNGR